MSSTQDSFYDLSLELPTDVTLARVKTERGAAAAGAQERAKVGWFGSALNWIGITHPPMVGGCKQSREEGLV